MAIALFPLLDGETIGSNLGRYGEFIGLETTLPLRRRLFGYACKPDTRLPSGLKHLVEETRDYWNLDSESVIRCHTEFHYATLTISERQRKAMLTDMLDIPSGRCSRRSACGWSGERVTRFRYCEDCLSDWKAKGVPAHWIVDHLLPGAYVCCAHSRMLKIVSVLSENLTDPTVVALKSDSDEDILVRASFSERRAIEDVARRSAQYRVANNNLPAAATYRELLRDAGLTWPNGMIDNRAFIACALGYFGPEYCRLAGLDWQKMTVWLRNIADEGRDRDTSHPFIFIAAESLLKYRCALPGSFAPAMQSTLSARGFGLLASDGKEGVKDISKLSCCGILHRKNDTWKECSRKGGGWTLACSCGVSYRASDMSSSEKTQLMVKAYGDRYRNLISGGVSDGIRAQTASRGLHAANARFLRWARYAGFSREKDLSNGEIQNLRNRWCSLVQNAQPKRRITSAHHVDARLYRMLSRYDRDWFSAFNYENRTRSKGLSLTRQGSEVHDPCEKGMDATLC